MQHRYWLPSVFTGLFWLMTACSGADTRPAHEDITVSSGGRSHAFKVEIADDAAEREQGLMHRDTLAPDQGMLFLFPDSRERAFWMRNTLIPLDIIYAAPDGTIISIQKVAMPLNETPLRSFGRAQVVLEIQGGLSDRLGIRPGDRIHHRFFEGQGPVPQ